MRLGMRQLSFSLRARLTIWYTLVLAAILVAYAGGVYAFLRQNLYRELDRRLHDDFEAAEASLERRADGTVIRVVSRTRSSHSVVSPRTRLMSFARRSRRCAASARSRCAKSEAIRRIEKLSRACSKKWIA